MSFNNLKVGDRVRVIASTAISQTYWNKEGVVKQLITSSPIPQEFVDVLIDLDPHSQGMVRFDPYQLLVKHIAWPPQTTLQSPTFKVGDRVRINNPKIKAYHGLEGLVSANAITDVALALGTYRVLVDYTYRIVIFRFDELILVHSASSTEQVSRKVPEIDCTCTGKWLVSYPCKCGYAQRKKVS